MKPQDLVVLLKLALLGDEEWTYAQLAEMTGLSQSQVHRSLQRAAQADLFAPGRRVVLKRNLREFLVHGARYAFPGVVGPRQRGVPTAHSAPPLAELIGGSSNYVWPDASGKMMGEAVEPLHRRVPEVACRDEDLHEMLALLDAIRVGRARERRMAAEMLEQRLQ